MEREACLRSGMTSCGPLGAGREEPCLAWLGFGQLLKLKFDGLFGLGFSLSGLIIDNFHDFIKASLFGIDLTRHLFKSMLAMDVVPPLLSMCFPSRRNDFRSFFTDAPRP